MPKIGELTAMPNPSVYRRQGGQLYLKLNVEFHVKTKLSDNGKSWLGDGFGEALDPNEEVELIQDGESKERAEHTRSGT